MNIINVTFPYFFNINLTHNLLKIINIGIYFNFNIKYHIFNIVCNLLFKNENVNS